MDEIKLEFGGLSETEQTDAVLSSNEEKAFSIEALAPDERQQIQSFVSKINIEDSNAVVTYGASAQNKIANFSDSVLNNVKTKDLGETGKLLSELVTEIQNFDSGGSGGKSGLFKKFGSAKKSMDRMVAGYSKVETNVDKIVQGLEEQRRQLLKDIALFDVMFENNYNYFKELNMYIIAGKEKLKEVETQTIPALRREVEETGDEVLTQRLNDLINSTNRFEKKIHDLQLSRMISLQMAPQIRIVQNNDAQLVDKIQSSIVNSVPLWKNQMVIALGLYNSQQALETQKKVSDMTNQLLRKNSEMLKQGSLEIAEEAEKGIISIETIQKTNQDLIETIHGVMEIQEKGREERKSAEAELMRIEGELKNALIETARGSRV